MSTLRAAAMVRAGAPAAAFDGTPAAILKVVHIPGCGAAAVWLTTAARLVVPVQCPGCGERDVRWCDECEALWWEAPWRSETGAGRLDILDRAPLPVWSVVSLEGSAHGLVTAWKDGGRRDLDGFMAAAARRASSALAPALAGMDAAVTVVPAPSKPRSIRSRGVDIPAVVARGVAQGLCDAGLTARARSVLEMTGRDARGLGARERWSEARAKVRVKRGVSVPGVVVLVDDVLTTGATLAASMRVLEARGVSVICAITLAATAPYSQRAPSRLG